MKSLFNNDGKHIAGGRLNTLISDGVRNLNDTFKKYLDGYTSAERRELRLKVKING